MKKPRKLFTVSVLLLIVLSLILGYVSYSEAGYYEKVNTGEKQYGKYVYERVFVEPSEYIVYYVVIASIAMIVLHIMFFMIKESAKGIFITSIINTVLCVLWVPIVLIDTDSASALSLAFPFVFYIVYICISASHLKDGKHESIDNVSDKLISLKKCLDSGAITQEEFDFMKQAVLKSLNK